MLVASAEVAEWIKGAGSGRLTHLVGLGTLIPHQVCEHRSRQRGDHDTPQRLKAWDETLADLHTHPEPPFRHRFQTDLVTPDEIAARIASAHAELTAIAGDQHA